MGATTAAIAGVSLLVRGGYRPSRTLNASVPPHTRPPRSTSTPPSTQTRSTPHPHGAARSLPAGAVKLGAASQLSIGQGATYTDPGDGQPDIVIRQQNGTLVAHSAVCTHAGCTVGYREGQIVCPCHGSIFNAQTGAVITGPAVTPLAPRKVTQRAGEIYALPA